MNRKAFTKYLCALLLFGLNGIVASRIAMNSYQIHEARQESLVDHQIMFDICRH